MGQIFGKEKPLKEVLRENKRMINRAVRELDREKAALEREEKRLQIEIKKAAKENQMGAVKIMAKVCSPLNELLWDGFGVRRCGVDSAGIRMVRVRYFDRAGIIAKSRSNRIIRSNRHTGC